MADRNGSLAPAMVLLLVLAGGYWLGHTVKRAILQPHQGSARSVFVEIVPGMGRWAIAGELHRAGVLERRWPFLVLALYHHKRTLKAGEYLFDRPMTPREVFGKLTRGEIFHYTVTVPEGYSMYDIAEFLGRMGIFKPEEFLAAVREAAAVRDLAPQARTLEGFLFPDTYQLTRRQTPAELRAAMVRRFREVYASLTKDHRVPAGLSTYEFVTLASMVEKETSDPEERKMIAGVFYNRLRRHLPLECDPTVIYAARREGRFTGTITQADLRRRSPYNTYLHAGLPPGAIANPGRAALEAVLFPRPVSYLYFVSNTEGGHFFSRTLAEHNRNVTRYRRRLAAPPTHRRPAAQPQRRATGSRP